jgi:hypothetical protein
MTDEMTSMGASRHRAWRISVKSVAHHLAEMKKSRTYLAECFIAPFCQLEEPGRGAI